MKKLMNLALAGTMILAAAACQREQLAGSQTAEDGTLEVTTQFVLNVAAAPQTKMSAAAVQQNNNYRGIQDGVLYTYKTGINVASATPYVLDPDLAADKTFNFPVFSAAGTLNNTGNNNQSGETATASKRVLQLSIPVGTDAVLFYGRAIKAAGVKDSDFGASNIDKTADDIFDKTGNNGTFISDTPKNTVIKAAKILDDATRVLYNRTGNLMIYLINDVLGTSVIALDTPGTIGTYAYTALPAVSWAQLGHQYELDNFPSKSRYTASQGVGHKVAGLEEVLGKCYYLFTYMTPSANPYDPETQEEDWKTWNAAHPDEVHHHEEYRAGSSGAVKSMIVDMYKIIEAASEAEATDDNEANAKRLAEQIVTNALKYFKSADGTYKEISTLKSAGIVDATTWNNSFEGARDLNNFPYGDFGIPAGAAQLGFHAENGTTYLKDEFYYKLPNQPLVNPTMATFEPKKYLYPAELWYYVNSPIRTSSDGSITAANYPDGVENWNTSAKWTGWTSPGVVASATRAVAVTHSINYGVALLKSNVLYSSATLLDNRAAMTDETTDRSIAIGSANLQLRGILVGGVNPRMNWQFIRKYESAAASDVEGIGDLSLFDGVIYDHSHAKDANDNDIPVVIPTTSAATFYTLVYDNYCSTGSGATEADNQNDVYVALEFVNGGEAFWGRDNLVPKDGIFYLVGKLPKPSPSQISGLSSAWPTDHQIPPVDANGASKKIARVFIQDFMTTADFKIGSASLKNAYYSIPDLRASQMSLGLSVDLKWTPGITYDVEL